MLLCTTAAHQEGGRATLETSSTAGCPPFTPRGMEAHWKSTFLPRQIVIAKDLAAAYIKLNVEIKNLRETRRGEKKDNHNVSVSRFEMQFSTISKVCARARACVECVRCGWGGPSHKICLMQTMTEEQRSTTCDLACEKALKDSLAAPRGGSVGWKLHKKVLNIWEMNEQVPECGWHIFPKQSQTQCWLKNK